MSVDRGGIAGVLGGVAGSGAAGIALLVCCATTATAAGGGLATTGGLLRSPWLIVAGVLIVALAGAAAIVHRTGRGGFDSCCPLSEADLQPAATKEAKQL